MGRHPGPAAGGGIPAAAGRHPGGPCKPAEPRYGRAYSRLAHRARTIDHRCDPVGLQPKDWIRLRLVDAAASEPSDASATLLYSVADDGWDETVVASGN